MCVCVCVCVCVCDIYCICLSMLCPTPFSPNFFLFSSSQHTQAPFLVQESHFGDSTFKGPHSPSSTSDASRQSSRQYYHTVWLMTFVAMDSYWEIIPISVAQT